jgi:tetratricopeptide (TPR) repeat protein
VRAVVYVCVRSAFGAMCDGDGTMTMTMDDAMATCAEARAALRGAGDVERAIALSARALEALVRLSDGGNDGVDDVTLARAHAVYGESLFAGARAANTVFGDKATEDARAKGTRLEDADEEECESEREGDDDAADANGADGADGEDGEEEEDDEDETDMELAWKMLENARVMFEEDGSAPLELADVLENLGELNTEQSQFEAALTDYNAALVLLETHLDATDRRLASALYSISMAHQLLDANDAALAANTRAIEICEARIAECKAGTACVSKGASQNAGEQMSPEATMRELEQIMGVAADLKERQEELKELVSADNSTREALKQAFMAIGGGANAGPASSAVAEESAGFAAPQLTSSLPVQAAPVRVQPAPVRVQPAPVKRAEPVVAVVEPDAKKLKPTAATAADANQTDAQPNGCPQQ